MLKIFEIFYHTSYGLVGEPKIENKKTEYHVRDDEQTTRTIAFDTLKEAEEFVKLYPNDLNDSITNYIKNN